MLIGVPKVMQAFRLLKFAEKLFSTHNSNFGNSRRFHEFACENRNAKSGGTSLECTFYDNPILLPM